MQVPCSRRLNRNTRAFHIWGVSHGQRVQCHAHTPPPKNRTVAQCCQLLSNCAVATVALITVRLFFTGCFCAHAVLKPCHAPTPKPPTSRAPFYILRINGGQPAAATYYEQRQGLKAPQKRRRRRRRKRRSSGVTSGALNRFMREASALAAN